MSKSSIQVKSSLSEITTCSCQQHRSAFIGRNKKDRINHPTRLMFRFEEKHKENYYQHSEERFALELRGKLGKRRLKRAFFLR